MRPVTTPLPLLPHPQSPLIPVLLTVECRLEVRELVLHYRLRGDPRAVRWPPAGDGGRADGLWKHTCFEAFLRGPSGESYLELNLAPSTQWAAYRFEGYRRGMAQAELAAPPRIEVRSAPGRFELTATVDLGRAAALVEGPWRLGLSTVIEAADGRTSYWALAHPPGKPDFHHPDCFALELPAPEGP